MAVTLVEATSAQEPVLQNLFQLYIHDFSEFWARTPQGEPGPDGRFEPYPLADYWARPDWSAFFIHSDGALAGFALVSDHAHSGPPVQSSVAEFFVLRKHRRGGVGRQAARALFSLRPGSWEVAVVRKNLQAAAFWRRTIREAAEAGDVVETDVSDAGWNGPILRFDWSARA